MLTPRSIQLCQLRHESDMPLAGSHPVNRKTLNGPASSNLTKENGTYYFVGLDFVHSGWMLAKSQLNKGIADGSISSPNGGWTTRIQKFAPLTGPRTIK